MFFNILALNVSFTSFAIINMLSLVATFNSLASFSVIKLYDSKSLINISTS